MGVNADLNANKAFNNNKGKKYCNYYKMLGYIYSTYWKLYFELKLNKPVKPNSDKASKKANNKGKKTKESNQLKDFKELKE